MGRKEEYENAVKLSKEHWEINASNSVFPKTNPKNQLSNFEAKSPKKWPRTHKKINECDY